MENAEDIVTAVEKVIKRNESIGRDAIAKICCDYVNKNFNFETNLNPSVISNVPRILVCSSGYFYGRAGTVYI